MIEYVAALRAIWEAWQDEERLDFRGEFYHHTSMEPTFTPSPSPAGPPKIYMAAVNPQMIGAAARVADGITLMLMPPAYLREVVLPTIESVLASAGRDRDAFEVCLSQSSFVGINRAENEDELKAALDANRQVVPYYFSVPNYRPILDMYGFGDLQPELHAVRYGDLPDAEKWARMTSMIPDELLLAVGTYGTGAEIPRLIKQKYGTGVDRYRFSGADLYKPQGTPSALREALS